MNINGYTETSSTLKEILFLHGDPDFVCLGETHLGSYEYINVPGYKYFGNSRPLLNGRKSGGVAIMMKEYLYETYTAQICCADTEGIIALKVEHDQTGYTFVLVSNYLPPVTSAYGKDPEAFFGRLLQLSYEYAETDFICYCGDFNARIGHKLDSSFECLPIRTTADHVTNSHGKSLLNFLNDSCACVLNGRFGEAPNTCHSYNGSSTVDYAIVPIDNFDRVVSFEIVHLEGLTHELGIEHLVGSGSALPDHDMLIIVFRSTGVHLEDFMRGLGAATCKQGPRTRIPRKFKPDYMSNERVRAAITTCIDALIGRSHDQESIDSCYAKLTKEILWEMDKFKKLGKRQSTPYKEYWSPTLTVLWQDMRERYKAARWHLKGLNMKKLRRRGSSVSLVSEFLRSQDRFDRELRSAKRKFQYERIIEIEDLSKHGHPKDFWRAVNKLGPRQNRELICEAFDGHGNVTKETEAVMEHWQCCFSDLYGTEPTGNFNDEFLARAENENDENLVLPQENDLILNRSISLIEVKKILDKAKKRKATGPDLIPTEALQNAQCLKLLHCLFANCFDSGCLPSDWSKCNIVPITKGKSSISTDPLSHRGLAMQSCVFKLYGLLLNERMATFMETNGHLHETQSGFRKGRNCVDHIFTLTETIRMNLSDSNSRVYCCFVDIKKAFPSE